MSTIHYQLKNGTQLGKHYRILDFLGSGWEGEVYKVKELRTGIIRAAKLFYNMKSRHKHKQPPLILHAKKLDKLKSCPIVMQYHHRGLARIEGEDLEFLVSDFIEGEMLSKFVGRQKKKRLSEFEALHLFYALVSGIEHIHYLGEYHGDIHTDNILVRRRGLSFDLHLIDFFHLGRPNKKQIQDDVYDLINVLFEMIGGQEAYRKSGPNIKHIILGRKHSLIKQHFENAGHLRLFLENLDWE